MKFVPHCFGKRDRITDEHNIDIGTGPLHDHVADIATDKITAKAFFISQVTDTVEYFRN